MVKKALYVAICFLLCIFAGCAERTPVQESSQPKSAVEENAETLAAQTDITSDSAHGAAETLEGLGAGKIVLATQTPDSAGTTVRVTTENGDVFYLGFGEGGYLEIVRESAADGPILYAAEE